MASGDILSCTIRADGWSADVVVDGSAYAVGATYDFGSLGSSPATTATPKFTMTVVSEGYSTAGVLGTVTRTIYGTHVVRKAYPNEASKDETDSGTTLSMRVALSESVYADDKNGGAGTSGTDPTVTISAGWCVSGANSSSAATALACVNNSTLAYPKVIAQWAWGHTPAWRQVTAATSIGCIAYHGHGMACVVLSATEGVNVVSGTTTSKTSHQMSASSLYYESYDLTVPVTSFTAGNNVTLKFVAYPLVGDASSIVDTSTNTTSTDDIRGLTQITFTYSPTVTTLYVAQNGNDTTGDGTTGNPYLTIGKALAANPGIIYVQAGGTNVVALLGSVPAAVTAKDYFIEVKPKPGDEATVSLTRLSETRAYKATKLLYSGFTIAGGNGYIYGGLVAGAKVWLENCTMSVASGPTVGLGYGSEGCWLVNCTETSGLDHFINFGTSIKGYSFTGFAASAGAVIYQSSAFVASHLTGAAADKAVLVGNLTGAAPNTENNFMFVNSKIMKCVTNGSKVFGIGQAQNITSAAVIGNVIEVRAITTSQPALTVAENTFTLDSCILAHNTVIGEKANVFYNDTGTASVVRTNVFCRNNAFRSYNIKTDTFGTPNASRVGNWAQVNGVNYSDNRYDGTVDSAFTNDYDGINVSFVLAKDAVFGQLGYTTDNSTDGAGTGNGDYLPTSGSVLRAHTLYHKYQSYDLFGTAV